MVHDIVVGGAAGLAAGFVAGLFALRVVDRVAVPFIIGAVFAVVGAIVLARHGRGRVRMTFWRIVAWAVFALGTGFLLLLYRAIDGLQ